MPRLLSARRKNPSRETGARGLRPRIAVKPVDLRSKLDIGAPASQSTPQVLAAVADLPDLAEQSVRRSLRVVTNHGSAEGIGMRWRERLESLGHWRDRGLNLIYPPQCAVCAQACPDAGQRLCDACREQLTDRQSACSACARTLAVVAAGAIHASNICPECKAERPRFQAAIRLSQYGGLLRGVILRLKHSKDPALGMAVAHLLVDQNGEQLSALAADVVVPMPMHWTRRAWRGVNNPDILAGVVSQRLHLPCAPHLLRMRRRTDPQLGLTRNRRLANVRGAFLAPSHPDLPGSRVLLVDDVMTTGATASEAARTLLRAGAALVAIAVLGRAEGLG